ncbi:MAG: response regulator transcription factor [Microgenomates group bacterium]
MSSALNVVCIEDDVEMAQYLDDVLQTDGHVVYVAHRGIEGLKLVEKIKPELVLLDLELPDITGQEVCQKIKEMYPHTKIIMITNYDTQDQMVAGLTIGADDYLSKPIHSKELLARIQARFRDTKIRDKILQIDDLVLDQQSHEVKRGDTQLELSAQEFKLLQYMMQNEGIVLTRNMIIGRIWNGNPDVETRVVDVYIGYLRKKIDFKKPNLIHTHRGFGYSAKIDSK